jgi:MFS superfamily sulfate permease-like transporter
MKGDVRGALGRDHVGAHREMNFAVPPGLANLSSYRGPWLRKDIVAGLVLTALLVPQGMAYAELAGLPPITGLYTSILCLVGYAIFGPSKILVLGPDSALGPMIAATILPITGARGDPERAVALASALALLVGTITALAGIAHLGFVADLISKPTILGYMNGLAVTILVSQLPKLFGFSIEGDSSAELLPHCVIFRFDAPLFFANSRTFREQIRMLAGSEPPPSWIIVASEPITDVDTTAADMLQELNHELVDRGICLVFAEMKDPVRTKVERYELTPTIDPNRFFPTLTRAIEAFRTETGEEWQAPKA